MNKAGIRKQFQLILNRNDCTDELADVFIDNAIARIQRTLRVPAMEKLETTTVNDGVTDLSIVLPADFLNIKYLYADNILLEYLDVGHFLALDNQVGKARVYTRIQGALKLKPTCPAGTVINMVYYGEIPDLDTDDSTNFLTAIAPDLLIYGALTFAADYFVDDRKDAFEQNFTRIYQEIDEQARLVEMEQSAMRIAPAYSLDY